MGAVKDQKANTSLTALYLTGNRVGDVGASALADALKAAVLTCKKCVFRARVRCHRKCCFTESSEELGVVNLLCIVRCGFCVFGGLKGNVFSFLGCRNCARVVLKLMWHSVRTKLDCLSSELQTERSPLVQNATSRRQDRGTEHDATAQNAP